MKLIDILVRESSEGKWCWPDGVTYIEQYIDNTLFSDSSWEGSDVFERCSDFGCDSVNIKEYEIALGAALAAKNDGWIKWGGGKVPVDQGVLVDCRYRDGKEILGLKADELSPTPRDASHAFWRHDGESNDIIAYRLHKPAEVKPEWSGEGLPPVGCECERNFNCHDDSYWEKIRVLWTGCDEIFYEYIGSNFNGTKQYHSNVSDTHVFRPLRTEADRKRDAACRVISDILDENRDFQFDAKKIYDAISAGKIPGVKLEG